MSRLPFAAPRGALGTFACFALGLLTGCGDATGTSPGGAGLRIVAGAPMTDTVLAAPPQSLVVQVRGENGEPQAGIAVRFQTIGTLGSQPGPVVLVTSVASDRFSYDAVDTTNVRGEAQVRLRFGSVAGPAAVAVSVPRLGVQDTARYIILPGAPARLRLSLRDTAVYVGASYRLAGTVTDLYGNPRNGTVSLVAGNAAVFVRENGTVTAREIGRGVILVGAGSVVDTAWVSVVPQGTLAAYNGRLGEPPIVMFNLDGSGYRPVLTTPPSGGIYQRFSPYWFLSGQRLAFHDGPGGDIGVRVYTVDLDGTVRRLVQSYPDSVPERERPYYELTPHPSRDGDWVYFGTILPYGGEGGIWRVRADGTQPERLGPSLGGGFFDGSYPSPSPNNARIVYQSKFETGCDFCLALRILDTATGAVASPGVMGEAPRWSPNSEWIAFVADRRIHVVRPDGTGLRTISMPGREYELDAPDWSPDGEWIVATADFFDIVDLIHVETGLTLPLSFTLDFYQPTWRP